MSVITQVVELSRDVDRVEAVGTARAARTAVIFAETSGEVTKIGFGAGDFVKRGAVLARLEDASERLAVARAKVAVKDAEQLLARYKRIDVPGAISDSQIDEARTALDAAQIELDLSELALSERIVRAPFSGYVGLTDIDAGARITTATEITRLDDRSYLYVDFDAPEDVFGNIKVGDTLPLSPFSGDASIVNGDITAIDSRIDATQRSFTIRTAIENGDDQFRPGMSFRVDFNLPGKLYPSVPEEAIIWGGDGAYIWIVEDDKAARLPVTLVSRDEGTVLIEAALEAGDLVVVEGVQKVRPGTPISPSSPVQVSGSGKTDTSDAFVGAQ